MEAVRLFRQEKKNKDEKVINIDASSGGIRIFLLGQSEDIFQFLFRTK
jgi:hypothetical protein